MSTWICGSLVIAGLFTADLPNTVKGKVVTITDGDGLTLETATGEKLKIQLNGIDAPEREQPFSDESRKALQAKLFEKEVEIRWKEKDRFERILGDVYLGEELINKTQIANGCAWHFKRYNDNKDLADAETKAREAKKGLWAGDKPEAPWDFRAKNRKNEKKAT